MLLDPLTVLYACPLSRPCWSIPGPTYSRQDLRRIPQTTLKLYACPREKMPTLLQTETVKAALKMIDKIFTNTSSVEGRHVRQEEGTYWGSFLSIYLELWIKHSCKISNSTNHESVPVRVPSCVCGQPSVLWWQIVTVTQLCWKTFFLQSYSWISF